MRKKFNNEDERKAARRQQNKEAQRRHRAKQPKATQDVLKPLPIVGSTSDGNKNYSEALFLMCSPYPFTHSITLTNNKIVTVNMHNKAVDDLKNDWVEKEYITNYIKTVEYDGGNFHTHFVVQSALTTKQLKDILFETWGNGFFKVVPITTDVHRLNAVRYCFKKLQPTAPTNVMQQLVDSWDASLVQSFEDLKNARIALLKNYKKENGLHLPIDFSKYQYKSFVTPTSSKP